jgi:hypothetical protein
MKISKNSILKKNIPILFLFFFCLSISVLSGLYKDVAISQDEILQNEYGKKVISFYTSLFKDKSSFKYGDLYLYGGFYETIAVAFSNLHLTGEYESRHIINAMFGIIGVLGVFKISNLFWNVRYSLLVSLTVFFYPTYFGHHFNNSKDIPFACLTIWSLYYIIRRYRSGFHKNNILDWKLGITIGLAMGVRVGGFIIYSYLIASLIFNVFRYYSIGNSISIKTIGKIYGKVILISYFVMLLFWPWASSSPLSNPLKALKEIQSFSWFGSVLFEGNYIHVINDGLPWNYTLKYLWIKTPEILLFFLFVYLLAIVFFKFSAFGKSIQKKSIFSIKGFSDLITSIFALPIFRNGRAFITFAFILPIGFIIYRKAVLYDEIRHIIFTIPFFIILSYMGLDFALNIVKSKFSKPIYNGFLLFLGFIFTLQFFHLAKFYNDLHPFEADYFNYTSGGFEKNYLLFQTDSLRNSRKELVETLEKSVPKSEGTIYIDFYENVNKELDKMRAFVELSGKDKTFLDNFIEENRKLKELHYLYFSKGRIKIAFGNEPIVYRIEFTNPTLPNEKRFLEIGRFGKSFVHVIKLENKSK